MRRFKTLMATLFLVHSMMGASSARAMICEYEEICDFSGCYWQEACYW